MAGWSFGAWVALRHALTDPRIAALALLGIPLAAARSPGRPLPSLAELEGLSIPVLFVAGDGDQYCPLPEMENLAGWIPRGAVTVVPGTDHFFGRREREVAALVGEWIEGELAPQTS